MIMNEAKRIFVLKQFKDADKLYLGVHKSGTLLSIDTVNTYHDKEKFFKIKNVIFNDPATIVYWEDGSKTVVKAQNGDIFDKEKGLALCFVKKAFDNKGKYNNEFHKWCK